jgi:hypothetical protein
MIPEEKELLKLKDDIKSDLEELFKKYLKVFDWDIPEANDNEASKLILNVMKEAIYKLDEDIKSGKFSNF